MNYLLLFAVTAIWGLGFIGTKWTLVDYSPIWSNSIRFILAGLIALPFLFYYKSYRLKAKQLLGAFFASIALLVSMLLQTWGLVYTTTAKSGFITCLYSLIIPVVVMTLYKKRYSIYFWGLLFQALVGIGLLCDLDFTQFNLGDFLTLICAFGFAAHFLIIDKITHDFPSAIELNSLQCFFVGMLSIALGLFTEGVPDLAPLMNPADLGRSSSLLGFVLVSVFSSFVAFGILAHVQKSLASHTVGIICLAESPFAAFFGFLFLSETLSFGHLVGASLVLLSVGFLPITEPGAMRALRNSFKEKLKKSRKVSLRG